MSSLLSHRAFSSSVHHLNLSLTTFFLRGASLSSSIWSISVWKSGDSMKKWGHYEKALIFHWQRALFSYCPHFFILLTLFHTVPTFSYCSHLSYCPTFLNCSHISISFRLENEKVGTVWKSGNIIKKWGHYEKVATVWKSGDSMKKWRQYEKVATVWKGSNSMKKWGQ